MQFAKKLLSLFFSVSLLCSALTGCGQKTTSNTDYTLNVCVGSGVGTLDPIYAQDPCGQTVLNHLYENLMRVSVNPDGTTTVTNGMAKEVEEEQNPDGTTTYTFKLRNAEWSDGKSVKADDFVYAWHRLVDPTSNSPFAALLSMVVGYEDARAGDLSALMIEAKNDSTLAVTLSGNYGWFLTEVCTSTATMPLRKDVLQALKTAAAAKTAASSSTGTSFRWWSDSTALVTNGPYRASASDLSTMQLHPSESYYGNVSGPNELVFHFVNPEDAQALYDSGNLDAVWPLTETQLKVLAENEDWVAIPELCSYSVLFNTNKETLADPLVRQAMHLAIDRVYLAQLAGVTAVPAEGIVPPGVPENEELTFRQAHGPALINDPTAYPDFCTQANELLDQAGYDSGDNLPELEYLYVPEDQNAAVANALCQAWADVLQLRVTPRAVSGTEFWTLVRSGEYDLAGAHLSALSNDAEWFLRSWVHGHPDNVIAYQNSAYDTLLQIIATAKDGTARMGCLHDAEVLLLEDYVIAPLYTLGTDWLLQPSYVGAARDVRGWFHFANTTVATTP